jgi:large subunit ribosomal protein L35
MRHPRTLLTQAGGWRSASIVRSMPKMKTHSGAKKRFRKTAGGKLRGRRAYSTHILEKKSPKRKRRFARPVEISAPDRKRVRELLGGGK